LSKKLLLFCIGFAIVFSSNRGYSVNFYGNISPKKYLVGKFNPAKHRGLFVKLSSLKIPTNKRTHYLRKETAVALKKMIVALKKDYPKIKIWVQSSTRNFYVQKYIWESKWTGKKISAGINYKRQFHNGYKRARAILKFSSMPGTSRHHWGTDFDLNILTNYYYSRGNGQILYGWLKKNAHRFGFCQPYSYGRKKGYSEEKWHWSYLPLSKKFLVDWNRLYLKRKNKLLKRNEFLGAKYAIFLAPIYVNSISGKCK